MSWLDQLLGRPKRAPEVEAAIDKRDQDFADLGAAIKEVDRLKNGIIADYERADQVVRRKRR